MTKIRVGDFFKVKRGNVKSLTGRQSVGKTGVRLISATGFNNGGEISVKPKQGETIYENKLAIGNNGSVGLGKAFFHPYRFIATSDVTIISPKDGHNLNLDEGLYLATSLEQQRTKFAYGFKLSNERLKNLIINLPLDSTGELDWIKMGEKINSVKSGIHQFPVTKNRMKDSISLNKKKWKQFTIEKVFGSPESGKDYPQYLRIEGLTPFIGSSSQNNGITGFINLTDNSPKSFGKNVISVNRNGSVGYSFYHPYLAFFSGDTRYLKLPIQDKYVALFLTTVIMQQKAQFGYGFKLGTNRLKELHINLPVNEMGKPDWKFIKKYMESLPNADLI
ncbi:restriction endonuclease subunit S [Limosilactobacillus sp. c11Ua_112_M]|uniref:restriction endonuclease subunit S n=1 Tax=Limosilactobacillus portuensis TaxID=2742601 RepID=UPI00177CE19D|nr:restriction endonuclease subunit S [Limosilactobacillus portuensis]MBD8087263.1 restriction endonuclease subunit S [Limosilactobacillus portuensis]